MATPEKRIQRQSKYNRIAQIDPTTELLLGEYPAYVRNGKERFHLVNKGDLLVNIVHEYYKNLTDDKTKYLIPFVAHVNNILNPLDISAFENKYIVIPDIELL